MKLDENWSIEMEKALTELSQHSHLYTASEMAAELNSRFPNRLRSFSRNSVIAKIRRKNIHWTNTRIPPDPNKPKRVFSGKNVNYQIERKERNAIKPRKASPFAGLIGSDALWAGQGIPLDGAPPSACRWPFLDGFGRHSQCCGKPIYEGSYCEGHYVIAKIISTRHRSIHRETPSVERVG